MAKCPWRAPNTRQSASSKESTCCGSLAGPRVNALLRQQTEPACQTLDAIPQSLGEVLGAGIQQLRAPKVMCYAWRNAAEILSVIDHSLAPA